MNSDIFVILLENLIFDRINIMINNTHKMIENKFIKHIAIINTSENILL